MNSWIVGDRADAARVERRRVDVPALHQAEHLARVAADLQRLAVEVALERVERPHDVADGAVAVVAGVRRLGVVGLLEHPRVGLLDHPLAVVHPDQVLLEDVVVEHVLRGLAEVDDPLAEVRRRDAVGHVLVVDRAGRVVVAADAADPAGDEVRVARVLALHEQAVAAEDRRGAVALANLLLLEVDRGVDPEAADDAGDRVPRHLDDVGVDGLESGAGFGHGHGVVASSPVLGEAGLELRALLAPRGFLVEGLRGDRSQPADRLAVDLAARSTRACCPVARP